MGVLSGPEIERVARETRLRGYAWPNGVGVDDERPYWEISIEPFIPEHVGPNSVDLRLANKLLVYNPPLPDTPLDDPAHLDVRAENPTVEITIPDDGYILKPGILYLGSTIERTRTAGLVPFIDGRSSVGRLGLFVHVTAGRGDDGFNGHWTLEILCVHPIRIYPGMRICQITYHELVGKRRPYVGRYQNQDGVTASRFHQPDPGSVDSTS